MVKLMLDFFETIEFSYHYQNLVDFLLTSNAYHFSTFKENVYFMFETVLQILEDFFEKKLNTDTLCIHISMIQKREKKWNKSLIDLG